MLLIDGNIVENLVACFFTCLQNCRYGMMNLRIESSLLVLLVSKATNERWREREKCQIKRGLQSEDQQSVRMLKDDLGG